VADRSRACSLPDFLIQLQALESEEELQLSGTVSQKTDDGALKHHTLESIRVKFRDLNDGLSQYTTRIDGILSAASPPAGRAHVVIACFEPMYHPGKGRKRQLGREGEQPFRSADLTNYTRGLLRTVEVMPNDHALVRFSVRRVSERECTSLAGWRDIA